MTRPKTGRCLVRYHPLYRRWQWMRGVCRNPKFHDYPSYGGRGIAVDPVFDQFWDFVQIVESRLGYPKGFDSSWKLARRDQSQDYTIRNMVWSQAHEVGRRSNRANRLTYRGRTRALREWSEITGIPFHTLWNRLHRGWRPAEILGYRTRSR